MEPSVSYVDDETVIIMAPSADTLATHTSAALTVIHKVFTKLKLELNFDPGKSEVLTSYNSLGSKAAKHNLFITMNKRIPFERSEGNFDTITVSNKYKHFGGIIATNGAMTQKFEHERVASGKHVASGNKFRHS